jgi:ATP-dependent DNA helicase RecG
MRTDQFLTEDVKTLIAHGLGEQLHWFPEDMPAEKLASVLVGMANTSGGIILVGISPRAGQLQGVHNPEKVCDCIFQAALLIDPPLVLPLPTVEYVGGLQVVRLVVPQGLPNVYSLDGRYFGREGAQTNPLPARRLRQLLVERGVVQFETLTPPSASLDDLDAQKVDAYLSVLNMAGGQSPWEILHRRGCLTRVTDVYAPTYAALLLFGRYPQQWLPNATILAARFNGITFADRFMKKEITGTLPEQLQQAEAFMRGNMRSVVRLIGLQHEETDEYPPEAVRELLVNAVAHRDYNLQGDNIHLFIFADRIEVHSPGGLPGPVTLENLLEARFSRNGILVQVLSDLGYIERLGYGLDRVVTSMRRQGLRPPRFEEVAGSFRVTLFGDSPPAQSTVDLDLSAYQHLDLNPRQQLALGYLGRHRRITSRDYQELCPDVHPETLRRDLVDLVDHDILIKVGDKRATYYILK